MNNKITKYLTADNPNLYGSIIAFQKGWRKKNPEFIDYYSFLLYFSHETGRIERFLYNSGNKNNQIFNNLIIDHNSNNETISQFPYNKKNKDIEVYENFIDLNKFINDIDKILELFPLSQFSFKALNDGKINKNMFISFLFELLRDYLIYKQSYKYCDMHILRKYTEAKDNITNSNFKLGTGKSIFKKELSNDLILMNENITDEGIERVYKAITPFDTIKYINYNSDNKLLLNIPIKFNNKVYKDFINNLENNKYETISLDKSNEPECLIDLKCSINSRNIINYQDLMIKIMKFNEFTNNKINKMKQ
jgi:hypothetical protein